MRALLIIAMVVVVSVATVSAKDTHNGDAEAPVAFGIITQNSGCVIFKEIRKTKAKFYGVAVATKTVSELEVVEAQNYTLERKVWSDDQDGMNELQRIATKDKIKFVKIPNKNPTQEQLEEARDMCKGPS